jgi:hypothetical protein
MLKKTQRIVKNETEGISLLLVVVLLSALLSISIGIFNLVFGQIKISGELADSFIAFYAGDQAIERILYRDRIQEELCPLGGIACHIEGPTDIASGGCFAAIVSKESGITEIITSGQYRCGANASRIVKRGFQVSY